METYRYKTWSGAVVTVQATTVRFEPGYVVFEDHDGRIVLAEDAANVSRLSNDRAVGEATRRLEP